MALRSRQHAALKSNAPVRWDVTSGLIDYPAATARMETEVVAIAGGAAELIWLIEHPPIYTAGTSAKPADLVDAARFPVYETGRGGQYTYHGPGQRVAYVMLDLNQRGQDVRAFVAALEDWIIATLATFNVIGERREERVGVWVQHDGREDKVAALGIRVRKGITFHGISINVNPELTHFTGIVPCGVTEHGVTSLNDLGVTASMDDVDRALQQTFSKIFGPIT
jgi:lipoyl(octanoyl) transferase